MGKLKRKSNEPKRKPGELETLLQTNNPSEQANRVRQLMRPTLTLAITLDARSGQVSLTNVGQEIPIGVAHQMLDAARSALVRMETKQAAPTDPAAPPATPEPKTDIKGE